MMIFNPKGVLDNRVSLLGGSLVSNYDDQGMIFERSWTKTLYLASRGSIFRRLASGDFFLGRLASTGSFFGVLASRVPPINPPPLCMLGGTPHSFTSMLMG